MPFVAPFLFGYAGTAAFAPTAGLIGYGGAVTGAGLTTAGALAATGTSTAMQYSAASQAGKTEKAWQEYNAAISEREAKAAQESASYEEIAHRKAGRRYISRMIAEYGKAGLSIEPGTTPYLTLEETAAEIEKDALLIRRGGTLSSQRFTSQAAIERGKGAFARRAGRWRSGATLLSGGTGMANIYGSYKGYF
jgi:hypothetical protein